MIIICLLLFSLSLLTPATRVTIEIDMNCPNRTYFYRLELYEEDIMLPDDRVTKMGNVATGNTLMTLEGDIDGDPPNKYYKFYVDIEHNCTGLPQFPPRKYLQQTCRTDAEKCYYKEWFDLTQAYEKME